VKDSEVTVRKNKTGNNTSRNTWFIFDFLIFDFLILYDSNQEIKDQKIKDLKLLQKLNNPLSPQNQIPESIVTDALF
jgi:hypothetical protein